VANGASNGKAADAPLDTTLSRGQPEERRPDAREDLRHEVKDALDHRDLDHAASRPERSAERLQVHLACAQRGVPPAVESNHQPSLAVYASARPRPALQATSRPCSASRARHARRVSWAGSARRCSKASSSPARVGSMSLAEPPSVAASRGGSEGLPPRARPPRLNPAQLRRQILQAHGHVQADSQHSPAFLRATLHEDARQLRQRR